MNILEKKIESQVQFWSLLGPFLILLSIAILLFKVSAHWYFPLSALIGVPLCVRWKMKGMAAALACLFCLSIIGYQTLELDERFWHVGMGLTMAFSFIILTLSLEEVEGMVGKLQLESQSRLDNFLRLDEKMKAAEQEWGQEKERLQNQTITLTQDLSQTQEESQVFYKLVQLAKDELGSLHDQHQQLLQDLFYKKQQLAQLNEKLEETEMTLQTFINSEVEQNRKQLAARLAQIEEDKQAFSAQLEVANQQIREITEEKDLAQAALHNLEKGKNALKDELEAANQQIEEIGKEKEHLSQNLVHCAAIEKEKNTLQTILQHVEQEKNTFKNQFEVVNRQIEEVKKEKDHLSHHLFQAQEREKAYLTEQGQSKQARETLQNIIQSQQEKFAAIEEEKQFLQTALHHLQQQHDYLRLVDNQHKIVIQSHLQKIEGLEKALGNKERELQALQQHKTEIENKQLREEQYFRHLSDMLQSQLRKVEEELISTRKEEQTMLAKLDDYQQQLEKSQQQLESAKWLHSQAEQELVDLKQQLQDQQKEEEKEVPVGGNTRKVEAMYAQLKEQFQQKSDVLDETRRELFHTQEKLSSLQKDLEEQQAFAMTEGERLLQKELERFNQEYESLLRDYEQEISDLHALISDLILTR